MSIYARNGPVTPKPSHSLAYQRKRKRKGNIDIERNACVHGVVWLHAIQNHAFSNFKHILINVNTSKKRPGLLLTLAVPCIYLFKKRMPGPVVTKAPGTFIFYSPANDCQSFLIPFLFAKISSRCA